MRRGRNINEMAARKYGENGGIKYRAGEPAWRWRRGEYHALRRRQKGDSDETLGITPSGGVAKAAKSERDVAGDIGGRHIETGGKGKASRKQRQRISTGVAAMAYQHRSGNVSELA
jgi:hypothetical protein